MYYRCEGILTDVDFCVLSDDLDHDVSFVYTVLHRTISYIKEELNLAVSRIHYFSDGCAAQYKNCKHSINLCHHFHDFSIECTWNFFATSHGKSPCDGIGGTVKRLTSQASLQCLTKFFQQRKCSCFARGKLRESSLHTSLQMKLTPVERNWPLGSH